MTPVDPEMIALLDRLHRANPAMSERLKARVRVLVEKTEADTRALERLTLLSDHAGLPPSAPAP